MAEVEKEIRQAVEYHYREVAGIKHDILEILLKLGHERGDGDEFIRRRVNKIEHEAISKVIEVVGDCIAKEMLTLHLSKAVADRMGLGGRDMKDHNGTGPT